MTRDLEPPLSLGHTAPPIDPAALRELVRFLDRHFDGVPGLAREYPLLLCEENRARCLVTTLEAEPIAHAAWRPLRLRSPAGPVCAAGIGLVTTHERWRGRGLATQLVRACLDAARGEGCELALLFGEARGLYRRLGFAPAGRERFTRLERGPETTRPDAKIRLARPEDFEVTHALLRAHPLGVERTPSEHARLLAIPGLRVWVLPDPHDVPAAYCAVGKGRDLRGVVHEWAGPAGAVESLLNALLDVDPEAEWVLSPADGPPPAPGLHTIGPLAQLAQLGPDSAQADPETLVTRFGGPDQAGAHPIYVWGLDSV